eukprot:scaffold1454_cov342-Pavlova_lutheri.AAC.3
MRASARWLRVPASRMARTRAAGGTLDLNHVEKKVFELLLAAVEADGRKTTLRCAGGWVRDKLMGKTSNDIDIALDNVLGKEFADAVNAHLKAQGDEQHHVAVILSNPEQSKHLETARMKILGEWIDFVNLRAESYAENSRIPTMQFGTPLEDAVRRDLTINALFYNINQGIVEDFTGKGMEDLHNQTIRTPLPPKKTFLDDPLRVLRAVRYRARFHFQYADGLLEAAREDDVRRALSDKISRERIGVEVDTLMKSANPVQGVKDFCDMNIFEIVFAIPGECLIQRYGQRCSQSLELAWEVLGKLGEEYLTPEEKHVFLYAALLLPLRHQTHIGPKRKVKEAAYHIIRDSLKLRTRDAEAVALLHNHAQRFENLFAVLQTEAGVPDLSKSTRIGTGSLIRDLGHLWKACLVLASLLRDPVTCPIEKVVAGDEPMYKDSSVVEIIELCENVEASIATLGLREAWKLKPLLDGKAVMDLLGMEKGGPRLGVAMAAQMEWQLANPGQGGEECKKWLAEMFAQKG